jgi:hypothetical protein
MQPASGRRWTESWHVGRDAALLCDAARNAIPLGRARHLDQCNHISVTLSKRDEGFPAGQAAAHEEGGFGVDASDRRPGAGVAVV